MEEIENMLPENVTEIIIHCADTEPRETLGVEDIDRWHRARGWKCCGYHYVVKTNGEIQLGRPTYKVGAHTLGENGRSIGICYIGGRLPSGAPSDTRTFAQKVSIAYLITLCLRQFPNIHFIFGHNDFSTKVCPCFDAKAEYKNFINQFNSYKNGKTDSKK